MASVGGHWGAAEEESGWQGTSSQGIMSKQREEGALHGDGEGRPTATESGKPLLPCPVPRRR